MNVYGLISGLNTQEIIDQLIEIQRQPRTRIESKLTDLQSQRVILQDIKARLLALQSKASGLKFHSTFTSRIGTSSDESIVNISSISSQAPTGTYEVVVNQLATPSRVESSDELGTPLDGTEGLVKIHKGKIYFQISNPDGTLQGKYAVEVGGTDTTNIQGIINAINSAVGDSNILQASVETENSYKYLQIALGQDYKIQFFGNSNLLQLLDDTDGIGDLKLRPGNSYQITGALTDRVINLGIRIGILSVNGNDIFIDSDTTLENLKDQLQNAGLSVSYDDSTQTLTISAPQGGNSASLAGKTDFLDVIGLTSSTLKSRYIGKDGEFSDTDALHFIDQGDQTPFKWNVNTGTFSINGTSLFVDLSDTIDDVLGKINSVTNTTGVTAAYQDGKIVLSQDGETPWINVGSSGDTSNFLDVVGLSQADQVNNGSEVIVESEFKLGAINPSRTLQILFGITSPGYFNINGTRIDFDPSDTLQDLIIKINSSDASVNAYYDINEDKFNLVSEKTGSPKINLQDGDGNLLSKLKLNQSQVEPGQDAKITVNGNEVISNSNIIDSAIPGVTLSLQKSAPGTTVKIEIEADVDEAVQAIQDFIDSYNETISYIREKVFIPLVSQQQTSEGTEESINTNALRGDPTLKALVRRLNQAMMEQVEGLPSGKNSLISIGIGKPSAGTVTLDQILRGLDITIRDYSKLREAIQKDPEGVAEIFATTSSSTQGIAEKIESILSGYTQVYTGVIDGRIQIIDRRISETNNKLEEFDRRIEETRQKLMEQYSKLEEALGNLQTQSSFLSQQLFNLQIISLMSIGGGRSR